VDVKTELSHHVFAMKKMVHWCSVGMNTAKHMAGPWPASIPSS